MGAVLRPIQGAGTRSRHTLAARCGGEVLSDGRSESFGLPDWNALVLEDVTRLARRKWVECVGGKWIYCSRVEYGRLLVHCSSSYPWIGTRGLFGTAFPDVNVAGNGGKIRGYVRG